MEIIQTDQTDRPKSGASCIASLIAASLLILGGLALLVYYLSAADGMFAMSVWQFSLYTLSLLVPIIAGGMWFNAMYRRGKNRQVQWVGGGLAFGLLLILVGIFMLGFATDAINIAWRPVFISWQMLLIVVGVFESSKGRGHIGGGLVAIMAGYFFILPRIANRVPGLIDMPEDFTSVYWPALLIAGGAAIVISIVFRPKWMNKGIRATIEGEFRKEFDKGRRNKRRDYTTDDNSGKVNYDLIFGGTDQVFLDEVFNGGEINIIFGGAKLDLRNTKLPEGVTYFDISTIFGGIEILAPADWNIELKRSAIFGSFNDNRRKAATGSESGSRLIIDVSCVFGGGEIR